MKIAPLNTVMQYNIATKKVNFGNNNNNKGINTPINQPQQIKPTLQQLQAHSGISFGSTKEDLLAFLNKADSLTRYAETFSEKTSVEDIKERFSQKPEDLKSLLLDSENGNKILAKATGEQIGAFAEILGDESPETFAQILPKQYAFGYTVLFKANAAKINAFAAALGDRATNTFAQTLPKQNMLSETALFGMKADEIQALAAVLGNEAPEVFAQILPTRNFQGETALFGMKADEFKALAAALGDRASEVLVQILPMQGRYGYTVLFAMDPDSLNALNDILGEDDSDDLSQVSPDKKGINSSKIAMLDPIAAKINAFGTKYDDKLRGVLLQHFTPQNNPGRTPLYDKDSDSK